MAAHHARELVVDAIRFDGINVAEIAEFLGVDWDGGSEPESVDEIVIELADGDETVRAGDYIVDDTRRFWVCPGPAFEQLYALEVEA